MAPIVRLLARFSVQPANCFCKFKLVWIMSMLAGLAGLKHLHTFVKFMPIDEGCG